jgi:Pretoxin HINT domain
MIRPAIVSVACLLCGSLLLPLPSQGAKRGEKPAAENADVTQVLRDEVTGAVDRREALGEILRSRTDIDSAHWQAGFVRAGEAWRSFDDTSLSSTAREKLDRYRERRDATPRTSAGQLQLADWCRTQGMPDEERAHLNRVLALDPKGKHAGVLERLGYRQIGGRWLSREQLMQWRESNRQAKTSLKRFGPKLERIAKQFSGENRPRETGLAALKGINDPGAIPAMELTLAARNETAALAVVEALASFDGYEAAIALAKQGVFSNWSLVREEAAKKLKSRTFEHFVPQLVGLLSTPIEGTVEVRRFGLQASGAPEASWRMQVGVLEYTYIMKRETGNQFQVANFNTYNSLLDDYLNGIPNRTRTQSVAGGLGNALYDSALERGKADAVRSLQDDVQRKDREVARQNDLITDMNQRVATVLATVSEQPLGAQPQPWWNWWDQFNDISGSKPVVRIVDEYETTGDTRPSISFGRFASGLSSAAECFAAGTLVCTESGPVAIESIRIGDRVLAKNVESGELAYKPVLETTVRPPKELQTLRFNEETIVCTGGHRFWISGSGWIKARDLAPASLLHTATGNTTVWSAKKGQAAETYNLVVADFHTYFVGKTGVLCQDVTLPLPTNKVVPGFDRSQIAARGK